MDKLNQIKTVRKTTKLSPRMKIYLNTLEEGMSTISTTIIRRLKAMLGQEIFNQIPSITFVRLVNKLRVEVIDALERKLASYPEDSEIWQDIVNLANGVRDAFPEDLPQAYQAHKTFSTLEAIGVVNTVCDSFLTEFLQAAVKSELPMSVFTKEYLTQYGAR